MKLFKRKLKEIAPKSVLRMVKESKYCGAINDLKYELTTEGEKVVWLNPSNQKCFNYGRFNDEELLLWLEGKGPIVKGKTLVEKYIFWKVAKFEKDHYMGWAILLYSKFFDQLKSERIPTEFGNFYENHPKTITHKNRKKELIKILNHWVWDVYDDIKIFSYSEESLSKFYRSFSDSWRYITKTMILMGLGYHSYVNTPEEIENLSWCRDLIFAKAMYTHLSETNEDIPTIEELNFVNNNRYKYVG